MISFFLCGILVHVAIVGLRIAEGQLLELAPLVSIFGGTTLSLKMPAPRAISEAFMNPRIITLLRCCSFSFLNQTLQFIFWIISWNMP